MIKVIKNYSYFLEKNEKQAIVYKIHKKGLTVSSWCVQNDINESYFVSVLNGKSPISKKYYETTIKPFDVKLKLPKEFK